MDPGTSYTVLRIKRKATEQPLSSLVIQDQDPSHPSSRNGFGTPKRRRDVSYRPKPRGVFKLADTVPDSWVGKGVEGEVLQERIRGLIGSVDVDMEGKGKERAAEQDEEEALNDPRPLTPPPLSSSTPPAGTVAPGVQYRVITQPALGLSLPRRRPDRGLGGGPSVPPVVRPYAEVEAEEQAKSLFRFIDAQAVLSGGPRAEEEEQDPQMAAFQDMLNEYLTLEKKEAERKEAEEEYVYDLYYRDIRDSAIALRAGDGGPGAAIGALIGFDDFSPPSSPSSSEPEDEADEDSNDEDFYRNDYPEDEDADEDMEGFDDAFASGDDESEQSEGPTRIGGVMAEEDGGGSDEDGDGDGDDEGGGGRGGKWGYR